MRATYVVTFSSASIGKKTNGTDDDQANSLQAVKNERFGMSATQSLTFGNLESSTYGTAAVAFGVSVLAPADDTGEAVELLANHHPAADEMDAYERVLGDAMAGDASLFAREDYVRRGASSILCSRQTLRCTNASRGHGVQVRSIPESHPLEAGITRG
jgi:hypothetical protein